MDIKEYEQKKWPEHKYYRIEEDGIFAELKINGTLTSRLVKFDEFIPETSIYSERPNPWAIGFFISLTINILVGGLLILENFNFSDQTSGIVLTSMVIPLAILSMNVFKFSKEKRINGYNIYLPFDYKKYTDQTDKFINEIFKARRNHFRTKFMKIDKVTASETIKANFHWLYQEELISESELLELQSKLEERRIIKRD
ncbi:MAG: hypothetical protein RIA69_06965 [Cyclobacteriaceae bacterium]